MIPNHYQIEQIFKFIERQYLIKIRKCCQVLLHSGKDYDYYKVPVAKGTKLKEGKVKYLKLSEIVWLDYSPMFIVLRKN